MTYTIIIFRGNSLVKKLEAQEQDFEKDKNIMPCPGQDPEEVRGQDGKSDSTECRDLGFRSDQAKTEASFAEAERSLDLNSVCVVPVLNLPLLSRKGAAVRPPKFRP